MSYRRIPQSWKNFLIITAPSFTLIMIFLSTSGVKKIHIGEWRLEFGRLPPGSDLLTLQYRMSKPQNGINCFGIFEGVNKSVNSAKKIQSSLAKPLNFSQLLNLLSGFGCKNFIELSQFELHSKIDSNADNFPLAFSILASSENPEQVFRLLRALYRPHNSYCIHVDINADEKAFAFYSALTECIPNLWLAEKRIHGFYASIRRLEMDMSCMETLLDKAADWKYLLNYAASEFPLRTNSEMVQILNRYQNQNDVEGIDNLGLKKRWEKVWEMDEKNKNMNNTEKQKTSPPYNLKIFKGSAYAAFTRDFVKFALHSSVARELYNWSKDAYSPDEFFWSTLQYNTHIKAPGGSIGGVKKERTWRIRWSNWLTSREPKCKGVGRRGICVFGLEDLQYLHGKQWFGLNKFDITNSRVALECIEEWHQNRTLSKERFPIDMFSYPLAYTRA